jgi:hypothetical protein
MIPRWLRTDFEHAKQIRPPQSDNHRRIPKGNIVLTDCAKVF